MQKRLLIAAVLLALVICIFTLLSCADFGDFAGDNDYDDNYSRDENYGEYTSYYSDEEVKPCYYVVAALVIGVIEFFVIRKIVR